jgi:adenine deaminase
MRFMKRLAAILLGTVLAACSAAPGVPDSAPDLILYNGKIITVDSSFSIAQAVAIRSGRFVAVGTDDAVRRTAGASTKSIDLQGRTVIPGLIDGHLHNAAARAWISPASGAWPSCSPRWRRG